MERVKEAFMVEYFNEQENERYNLARHYGGSRFAIAMALYNTFTIRQRIFKNAIHLTKSNNPTIVKIASVGVGLGYFLGLCGIWLIPSFATESAVRMYYGCETATMAWMLSGQQIAQRVFNQTRRNDLMSKQNIGVKTE